MPIFVKDFKELSKNMYVLTTLLTPLLLAFVFGQAETVSLKIQLMIINITFVSVTAFVQSAIIAEEKEKNTLRGLMMSPASTADILGGKSLLSVILTVGTMILCLLITDFHLINEPMLLLALLISLVFYAGLGTLLGLWTKSLLEASVAIVPVIFILGMGTLFQKLIQPYPLLKFMEYFPNFQLEFLTEAVEREASFGEVLGYFGVITGWTVLVLIVTVTVYRKRSMDE